MTITPWCSESCRIAGATVGKGYSSKQSSRQQSKLAGRRSPCEPRRGQRKRRAIVSHDTQKTLSITPGCSESCRIAVDTVGKGYSSKQARGFKKNASDSEPQCTEDFVNHTGL